MSNVVREWRHCMHPNKMWMSPQNHLQFFRQIQNQWPSIYSAASQISSFFAPNPNLPRIPNPKYKTLASRSSSRMLFLTRDDRFKPSEDHIEGGSKTFSTIVTSLDGGLSATGIVRASGTTNVEIAGKVFGLARRGSWRAKSHFVEYGVASRWEFDRR